MRKGIGAIGGHSVISSSRPGSKALEEERVRRTCPGSEYVLCLLCCANEPITAIKELSAVLALRVRFAVLKWQLWPAECFVFMRRACLTYVSPADRAPCSDPLLIMLLICV